MRAGESRTRHRVRHYKDGSCTGRSLPRARSTPKLADDPELKHKRSKADTLYVRHVTHFQLGLLPMFLDNL